MTNHLHIALCINASETPFNSSKSYVSMCLNYFLIEGINQQIGGGTKISRYRANSFKSL